MTYDINAAIAAEVATGPDMTKSVGGGGEREVAKEGPTRLRFVSYLEVGKHTRKIKGIEKEEDQVQLVFELSGKNHPPREFDGKKYPQTITIKEKRSLNEKANFFKLFSLMNWEGKATHMAQLLGNDFLGTVSHYKFDGQNGEKVTLAQLRGPSGYTIRSPFLVDPETDQNVRVKVDPVVGGIKAFFWNTATKDQWDSLFIDGNYDAVEAKDGKPARPAKSKNILQNYIKQANNFKGSKIAEVLATNGISLDLPAADVGSDDDYEAPEEAATAPVTAVVPTGKAADDALNGIV